VKSGAKGKVDSSFSLPQWGRMNIDDTQRTRIKKYVKNERFKGTALCKLMSNVKDQSSNEVQSPNKMPKQVRHDKVVILNSFQNLILQFDIHLTFGF